jgi:bifunctional non-homologous end joining protein LigD
MSSHETQFTVEDQLLRVSNLDKVMFPEGGVTKGELIDYYVRIAPVMLPHIADRPLTMRRYPDGTGKPGFYEKHIPSHAPDWVRSVEVPTAEGEGEVEYAVVCDVPTLIWAANLGAIELHVPLWHVGRRRKLPAPPDCLVFDLDPGEGTSIVECCVVARLIGARLEDQGRPCRLKTSGSKGLQLYTMPESKLTWERSRQDARSIADDLSKEHGDLVTANMRKDLRRGKVLIDWSQNHPSKTTVACYSVRARPRPTVSSPIRWQEVDACAKSGDPADLSFTIKQVLQRVKRFGDLFAG